MKRPLTLILGTMVALIASAEDKSAHLPEPAAVHVTRQHAEQLKGAVTARSLLGMTVKNPLDETLGQVADLVLDVESGRIVAVIVTTGGFLGEATELSAVPPTALRMNPGGDGLQLRASKALLRNAPHFKAGEWPDFTHTGYVGGIYRAYQLQPYFTTDTDNSGQPVRGSDGQILTSCNQEGSKDDVATTAQIRQEISAGKDLSVKAQNVQVTTQRGRVTLRGPVNTFAERRAIEEIAARLVGPLHVDSQIAVPVTTTSSNGFIYSTQP